MTGLDDSGPALPDTARRLVTEMDFLSRTSSPEIDEYRRVIHEQYEGLGSLRTKPRRVTRGPSAATLDLKRTALRLGADLVGVCTINQSHVFRGRIVPFDFGVVLGRAMNFDKVMTAPSVAAQAEVTRTYALLGQITIELATHIRNWGYEATVHHPAVDLLGDVDSSSDLLFIPHAVAAGLGELGRSGIMLSDLYGPRLRLAMISTELPMVIDEPMTKGIAKFCELCERCERKCPGGAISGERRMFRGSLRYITDSGRCLTQVAANWGCRLCVKECALNRSIPEQIQSLLAKVGD